MLNQTIKESTFWETKYMRCFSWYLLFLTQIQKIQRMLEEEKDHREQVLQAKYRDMANLETKFSQLIEGEINVWNLAECFALPILSRPEKKVILDLLDLLMKDSTVLELNWSEKASLELKISILLTTLLRYENWIFQKD